MNQLSTSIRAALAAGLCLTAVPLAPHASTLTGSRYFHQGHLGSVVALSGAGDEVQARASYQPYGAPRVVGDTTDADSAARFTGKARDTATGFYYFEARYADPGLGRFVSADPVGQTSSTYAYVGDAPLANVDPDGRMFTSEEGILITAAANGTAIDMGGGVRRVPDIIDVLHRRAARLGIANPLLAQPAVHRNPVRLGWRGNQDVDLAFVMMDVYVDLVEMRHELTSAYQAAVSRKRELNRLRGEKNELKKRIASGREYLEELEAKASEAFSLGPLAEEIHRQIIETNRLINSHTNDKRLKSKQLKAAMKHTESTADPKLLHGKITIANRMLNTLDDIVNYKPPRFRRPMRPAPKPPHL